MASTKRHQRTIEKNRQRAAASREEREAAEKAQRRDWWLSLAFLPVMLIVWFIILCGMPLGLLCPTFLRKKLTPVPDGNGSEILSFYGACGSVTIGILVLGAVVLFWLG
jgi:hypothetical protein